MRNVPEFDGLRGYLSTLIVVGHIYYPLVAWGLGCMDLFFTLSAYLISTGIIRNYGKPGFYKSYIKKRIIRIWPNYYILLFSCLLLSVFAFYFGKNKKYWLPLPETIQNIFFLQNVEQWFCRTCEHINYSPYMIHSWSLALEEQFYVLILLIIWIIARRSHPVLSAFLISISLIVTCTLFRLIGVSGWTLPGRFDAFSTGILLSVVSEKTDLINKKNSRIILLFLILSFLPIVFLYAIARPKPYEDVPQLILNLTPTLFSVFGFFLFAFIKIHTGQKFIKILRVNIWVALGRMSYSTYLWHMPSIIVMSIVLNMLNIRQNWLILLFEVMIIFFISRLAYLIIERPMQKFTAEFDSAKFGK